MRKWRLILFVLISAFNLHAQPVLNDSLRQALRNSPDDTTKVKLLSVAIRFLPFNQPDSGLFYADSIIRLSEKIDFAYGKANGYYQKGASFYTSGDYSKAMFYHSQGLVIMESIGEWYGKIFGYD